VENLNWYIITAVITALSPVLVRLLTNRGKRAEQQESHELEEDKFKHEEIKRLNERLIVMEDRYERLYDSKQALGLKYESCRIENIKLKEEIAKFKSR